MIPNSVYSQFFVDGASIVDLSSMQQPYDERDVDFLITLLRAHPNIKVLKHLPPNMDNRLREKLWTQLRINISSATSAVAASSSHTAPAEKLRVGGVTFNLTKFKALFQELKSRVHSSQAKELVFFVGRTGGGKSTTINYLMGRKMLQEETDVGEPRVIVSPDEVPYVKIGHSTDSETLYCQVIPYNTRVALCDCPGFEDSRAIEEACCASLGFPMALRAARNVKAIVVVIPYSDLKDTKATVFAETIKTMSQILLDPMKMKNSVFFVVTKTPSHLNRKHVAATIKRLLEGSQKPDWYTPNMSMNQEQQEEIARYEASLAFLRVMAGDKPGEANDAVFLIRCNEDDDRDRFRRCVISGSLSPVNKASLNICAEPKLENLMTSIVDAEMKVLEGIEALEQKRGVYEKRNLELRNKIASYDNRLAELSLRAHQAGLLSQIRDEIEVLQQRTFEALENQIEALRAQQKIQRRFIRSLDTDDLVLHWEEKYYDDSSVFWENKTFSYRGIPFQKVRMSADNGHFSKVYEDRAGGNFSARFKANWVGNGEAKVEIYVAKRDEPNNARDIANARSEYRRLESEIKRCAEKQRAVTEELEHIQETQRRQREERARTDALENDRILQSMEQRRSELMEVSQKLSVVAAKIEKQKSELFSKRETGQLVYELAGAVRFSSGKRFVDFFRKLNHRFPDAFSPTQVEAVQFCRSVSSASSYEWLSSSAHSAFSVVSSFFRSFFQPIPSQEEVGGGIRASSQANLHAATSSVVSATAQLASSSVSRVSQAEVDQLVLHVARGEQEEAEELLKKNPTLALHAGQVTDYSDRTSKNITAFQYAVWALDWHMWLMILNYLPEAEAKTQLEGLGDQHYDFQPLLQALKTYVDNFNFWSSDQRRTHWIKVVGGQQRLVPAHVANEYCRPDRSFEPCPGFEEAQLPRILNTEGLSWFPLRPDSGLGFDFGFLRDELGLWWEVPQAAASAGGDLAALTMLCEVRHKHLSELRRWLGLTPLPGLRPRP